MGDWTPEAEAAIKLCKAWAAELRSKFSCDVYLFGSAIYEGGDQFDAQLSDLDLVVHFRDELDATGRSMRLQRMQRYKADLELRMVPALHRTNCEEPGVSVLPVTTFELLTNIHKGKSRHFFTRNIFLDLLRDRESIGIPGAGLSAVPDETRQALEFSQDVRNHFLAVSANETGGLKSFNGPDPLPKGLARTAAQLVPDPVAGGWYDTRYGLEFLFEELSRRRGESDELGRLYRTISVRRGGRGQRSLLSAYDQVLLAEVLYDRAVAVPIDPLVIWEIRFAGPESALDRARLLTILRALVPGADVLGIFSGSVVVRLRTSLQSFKVVERLQAFGILARYFDVDDVDLALLDGEGEAVAFPSYSIIDRVAEQIARWRPQSTDSPQVTERHLVEWLQRWIAGNLGGMDAAIFSNAQIGDGDVRMHADLLLQINDKERDNQVVIEVTRVRKRHDFFAQVGRAQRIALPVILVLVGTADALAGLDTDIRALERSDGGLRIISVVLDNG